MVDNWSFRYLEYTKGRKKEKDGHSEEVTDEVIQRNMLARNYGVLYLRHYKSPN